MFHISNYLLTVTVNENNLCYDIMIMIWYFWPMRSDSDSINMDPKKRESGFAILLGAWAHVLYGKMGKNHR